MDIYQQLAQHLDGLPAGFPATESGVELRILKRLFTPLEAETALNLTMMPESAAALAERLGQDEQSLAAILEEMSRKGLIFRSSKNDEKFFMAAQFVIGIWEYHVNDLDEDLIRDMNTYIPHLAKKVWIERETKQLRVIPVAESISAEMQVMPYEAAEEIIAKQKKIIVAPCICRKEHAMVGQGCGKLEEACLVFGTGATFYEENGLGRPISQPEALDILSKAKQEGLVLQPSNSQKPVNICLCCGCCCQILKTLNSLDSPAQAVASNYYARVDAENCTACEACSDACQMDAIEVAEVAQIDLERCIGCGLCVPACDFDAMGLVQKSADTQHIPPKNTVMTYIDIAKERGLI